MSRHVLYTSVVGVFLIGAIFGSAFIGSNLTSLAVNDNSDFSISADFQSGTNYYTLVEIDEGDNDEEEQITWVLHEFKFSSNVLDALNLSEKYNKIHPATKSFQAFRILINNELDELKRSLENAEEIIKRNGFIVTIAFHSLEDNIVKNFFRPTIKSFPTIKKKNTFRKSSTVLASMNVCSIAFLSTYLSSFQIILVNIPVLIIHRIISGQDRMTRQKVWKYLCFVLSFCLHLSGVVYCALFHRQSVLVTRYSEAFSEAIFCQLSFLGHLLRQHDICQVFFGASSQA